MSWVSVGVTGRRPVNLAIVVTWSQPVCSRSLAAAEEGSRSSSVTCAARVHPWLAFQSGGQVQAVHGQFQDACAQELREQHAVAVPGLHDAPAARPVAGPSTAAGPRRSRGHVPPRRAGLLLRAARTGCGRRSWRRRTADPPGSRRPRAPGRSRLAPAWRACRAAAPSSSARGTPVRPRSTARRGWGGRKRRHRCLPQRPTGAATPPRTPQGSFPAS